MAINTRIVRCHGYTPAQLFMGFNPIQSKHDLKPRDTMMVGGILQEMGEAWGHEVEEKWEENETGDSTQTGRNIEDWHH